MSYDTTVSFTLPMPSYWPELVAEAASRALSRIVDRWNDGSRASDWLERLVEAPEAYIQCGGKGCVVTWAGVYSAFMDQEHPIDAPTNVLTALAHLMIALHETGKVDDMDRGLLLCQGEDNARALMFELRFLPRQEQPTPNSSSPPSVAVRRHDLTASWDSFRSDDEDDLQFKAVEELGVWPRTSATTGEQV